MQGGAQGGAEISEPIELAGGGLSGAVADGCEIIPVYGRRAGGDGAGGTLGVIMLVARHAMLGGHVRRNHFQQVELGGDLEHRAGIFSGLVQVLHVADDDAGLEPSGGIDRGFCLVAESFQ